MADSDDLLRDIEASLADLRAGIELLESGVLHVGEFRPDGSQVDTTQARILWYKREIDSREAVAARIRSGEFK